MQKRERQGGWLLVELMMAMTILALGVLGLMASFQSSFRASKEIASRHMAQQAIKAAAERLRGADFSSLYVLYNDALLPAPGLKAPDGTPAVVKVEFDVNETAMPLEYGPISDIDGDGAMGTIDASGSYELLPCRLTVTYQMPYGPESKTLHLVFGP